MAAEETTLGVTGEQSDSATLATGSPPAQDTGSPPSQDVNTGLAQQTDAAQQEDPLAGLPTLEELEQQRTQGVRYAEGLHRLRGAYEPLKTQFDELQTKFKPFEPYADRFTDPQQVEQLVNLQESLWKLEPDPRTGEVVPVTKDFAEGITESAPETADQLAFDLAFGQTRDSITGQPIRRLDVLIQDLAKDPAWKSHIVKLAGYDPTQTAAPDWEPTLDEIDKVQPELLDTYKKLPYEKRMELAETSPAFLNDYLRTQKLLQDSEQEKTVRAQQQQAYQAQQQEVFRQEAIAAGNSYIDSEVNTAFSGFHHSLVERYKPTSDPVVNEKLGLIVSGLTLALSHNETRGPLLETIKKLGLLDDRSMDNFDRARNDFAQNAFNYGNKSYVRGKQRERFAPPNGNGQPEPDLGMLKTNASRSLQGLLGQANNIARVIYKVLDEALVAKANSHNSELDQAETARRHIPGTPANPVGQIQTRQNTGNTREEVWGRGV